MRDRAVRDVEDRGAHVLAIPHIHKVVITCLFVELLTAEHVESAVALEFFRAYRFLFDGGTLDELPIQLIEKQKFLHRVKSVLAGKQLLLEDDQHDRSSSKRREGPEEEQEER
jgi:hypothetical protein